MYNIVSKMNFSYNRSVNSIVQKRERQKEKISNEALIWQDTPSRHNCALCSNYLIAIREGYVSPRKEGSAGKMRSPLNKLSSSVLQECSTSILLMVELTRYRKCSPLSSPALMAASKKWRVCQLRNTIRGIRSLVAGPAVEMRYIESTLKAIFRY